ncbi:hypothetical protein GCM10009574_084310 [Streptomyces asiaticus]|uniref:Uncharacterized protein n=3 Tax=Streptomyces TaxID=1883 RepID=A0ABN1RD15_9ACTN|nr:hypothetical protein [Streptomyces asiaticus]
MSAPEMSTTNANPGPLPEDVADLLRAVLEALRIPFPATFGDTDRFREVLDNRAMDVVVAIEGVLSDPTGWAIGWITPYLRKQLAKNPPTGYRTAGDPRSTKPSGEADR